MKFLITAFSAIFLGGCALIQPSATSHFDAKPGTSVEAVFVCAEATIRSLNKQHGIWSDLITTRDVSTGLLETNRFNEVNIAGIRAQIKYKPNTGDGRIKIKASGPYFIDLGAKQAAAQLSTGITQCL